ncbi:3-phosphoglycerate dehydrogenase family protein [Vibrio sp. ZSDZ34]|jgi:D-3-phosphoglycerate dehydrogenase|uniref:D-3-phosphoglycerate dehydrogenase n=1 Tax=Vibrio gelatinilyticus TaxID=2893468 RepID=A0A9X2AZ83_9VIBR|nr:3-phosphoglycerate dehydrogenase family protein [Vibrio gelatinilyticus]MCJ2377487.1 3-phosphoglycerate dehydrogenase family protein [Vibrio gelatinilyticus]
MKLIKTYNAISAKGLDIFPRDQYEVSSECSHPDAILLRSQKLHDEPIADSVKAIARCGAGVNNIPIDKCIEKGIVVFNTPGANANAVKELVLTGLLLASRDIKGGLTYADSLTQISDAGEMDKLLEKEKKRFSGSEIRGKTLGVVGLGAIGALVANTAIDLGMNVIGFDSALSVEAAWRLSSDIERAENLQSLVAKCDFVTVHVPALETTKGMINSEVLGSAKKGLVLLNFARKEIVDTDAAITALENGQLSQYISDFPTPSLIGRDNVILMPHIGASTSEAEENCAVMGAQQLIDFIENGNIVNSVNFPRIKLERTEGYRITFANDNVPKVLGHVLSMLADLDINVLDMLNKSRNEVAYTILDVEQEPTAELLFALSEVEHVFNVRAL